MRKTLFIALGLLLPALQLSAQTIPRVANSPYPTSNIPDRLFLTSENYSYAEKVALQSLMGVIAQTKPEILRDRDGHPEIVEAAGYALDSSYYLDFDGLLAHFAPRLNGYILSNTMDHSTNVALSLAGVMNAVAIPAEMEQVAINAGLKRLLDVRGRDEVWAINNYGNLFNKNMASYQSCTDGRIAALGDYSVFSKSLQFYDDDANGSIANAAYNILNSNATIMGWGLTSEADTVRQLSLRGMSIHAADHAVNISTLTNMPAKKAELRQPAPIKPYESIPNKHTVTFVISDGDNVQWLMGAYGDEGSWLHPKRGQINLGWTISPALVELAPLIYEKYIDNVATTPNGRNVLISGPSGRGYFLPGLTPLDALDREMTLLNRYMKKADLHIVNVIDADDSNNDPEPYLKQSNIDTLFYYSFGEYYCLRNGQIDWYKEKPSIGGRHTLWGDKSTPESLAAEINAGSTNIYSQDGYSLISVHAWTRGVDDIIDTISRLNPNIRVVAPDEFVWLVKKNIRGLPMGQGDGLRAEYFEGYNQNTLKLTRVDRTVDFEWMNNAPAPSLPADQFSVRWTGKIQPLFTEQYTFYIKSDDGIRFKINGQTLIDDYNTQGAYTRTANIALTAGQKYDIQLEYAEGAGQATAIMEWESASQSRQVVPQSQLFSGPINTSSSASSNKSSSLSSLASSKSSLQSSISSSKVSSLSSSQATTSSSSSSKSSTSSVSSSKSSAPTAVLIQAEVYSGMRGVFLEPTTDIGGGQNVGGIDRSDSMTYKNSPVYIPQTAEYTIEFRVASDGGGGRLALQEVGSLQSYGSVSIPDTGDWQNWTTVRLKTTFTAGTHKFKITAKSGGFNVNWFRILPSAQ